MNPVLGCAHGCRYPCYAWLMAMRFGKVKSYSQWIQPAIVGNTLELLEEELRKWHWKIHHVQLCLTTDPFMVGYPEVRQLSLASIGMINQNGIPCGILTKGCYRPNLRKWINEILTEFLWFHWMKNFAKMGTGGGTLSGKNRCFTLSP